MRPYAALRRGLGCKASNFAPPEFRSSSTAAVPRRAQTHVTLADPPSACVT
jgi:hypothetical protein